MIERCLDAHRINAIINHPDVLPWVAGPLQGELDISPVLADSKNVALAGEHGAMLFAWIQPCMYEAHTLVLPQGRGRWTLDFVHAALAWMFLQTDATEILTRCPKGNLGAKALVRAIEGDFQFTAPAGWQLHDRLIPADVYAMSLERWVRLSPALASDEDGDPMHRRHAAAAAAMARCGQMDKALRLYNRWALVTQHHPMSASDLQV